MPRPLVVQEAIPPSQLEFPFDPRTTAGDPAFLTIAEAAARVRCCERTIRRAIDTGALRAGVVRRERGGRGAYRIRPADLDAWLFGDA
ncbi:MAG: DNA-binding protein [Solirubrobacterales bacterium]|nr:DNA-binding protein [Solirubrobacterales bacterium]